MLVNEMGLPHVRSQHTETAKETRYQEKQKTSSFSIYVLRMSLEVLARLPNVPDGPQGERFTCTRGSENGQRA